MNKDNQYSVIENEEELDTSVSENSIYPMNDIKVEKGFYSLFELKRKYDRDDKKIVLDSDFQRNSVWKIEQKRELIESVLMGLPLPIFYFNEDKMGRLIVIDGRQRLTAIFEFLDGKYKLDNLKILSELNKKNFEDLAPVLQSKLEDYQIQAHVIMPPTPDKIKFDIFDRVNRGGTQLNKQEIRNALYQGKATELLKRLSRGEDFKKATGNAFALDKKMKDKYLLTRFIAFYLYFNKMLLTATGTVNVFLYKNDIDELLGVALESVNKMGDAEVDKIEKLTNSCLRKAYYYLGGDGFRLMSGERKTPINMNLFETVMYAMTFVPDDYKNKKKVADYILRMCADEGFINSIGNHRDSLNKIKIRFQLACNIKGELGSD